MTDTITETNWASLDTFANPRHDTYLTIGHRAEYLHFYGKFVHYYVVTGKVKGQIIAEHYDCVDGGNKADAYKSYWAHKG
jgi:hypothetical protein